MRCALLSPYHLPETGPTFNRKARRRQTAIPVILLDTCCRGSSAAVVSGRRGLIIVHLRRDQIMHSTFSCQEHDFSKQLVPAHHCCAVKGFRKSTQTGQSRTMQTCLPSLHEPVKSGVFEQQQPCHYPSVDSSPVRRGPNLTHLGV
jgi:hypothetical protein